MIDPAARPVASPEMRASLYFSTMFLSIGAAGAYLGIWMSDKGLSSGDIGIVNSVPVLIMLALNLVVGRIADRASDWRGVIVFGSLLAGVLPIGLFFVDGFWGILIVWTLCTLPFASVAPVMEAATMRMTRRNGTDYAQIRGWGSASYMVALAVTGLVVAQFGAGAFLPLLVGLAMLRGLAALQLPRFRAPEGNATAPPALAATKISQVMKPWFVLAVLAFALVQGTHFLLNAFAAIAWKDAGISEAIIGPLLALGGLAEVGVLFLFKRFADRFSARHLILIAALTAAFRWTVMAFNPPAWGLALLQLLHGITFGFGYLGTVNFIANWTSEDVAAEAQSFAVVLQQAMSVTAMVGFGYLFGVIGMWAFAAAGGFALIGALMVGMSLRLATPKG